MSALPEDPGHFVAWRARHHPELLAEPGVFAPRARVGPLPRRDPEPRLRRTTTVSVCGTCACGPRASAATAPGSSSTTDDGRSWRRRRRARHGRAAARASAGRPTALRRSAFFVPDPWAPGALDVVRRDAAGPADVLLVGTGLTMVDVVLSLTGAGAASRPPDPRGLARTASCRARHADELQLAAIPEIDDWGDTPRGATAPARPTTSPGCERATGDWRPAVDGLRTVVQALWQRLGEADRAEFLRDDASALGPAAAPDAARARPTVVAALERAGRADPAAGRGRRRRAADRGRPAGHALRRHRPRGRLGGQLHRHQHRRTPGRRPARRRPAHARAAAWRSAGPAPPGWACARATGGSSTRPARTERADLDPRLACAAASCGSRPRSPRSGARPRTWPRRCSTRSRPLPRRLADGRVVGGHHPLARPRDPLGPAAVDDGRGRRGVQRRAGAADAAAVRRRGAAAARPSALDPGFALAHAALAMLGPRGRRRRRRHRPRSRRRREAARDRGPTSASAAWSTWSAAGSRTSGAPAPPR